MAKPKSKPTLSKSRKPQSNPFDVRSNAKTKYEVLGRRVKGQGRNVAAARSDAEQKRKQTLASQFKSRNKANAFHDRRLGEADVSMSVEDKMMARFQRERKRKLRNAQAFALGDSDDDENDDDDELFLTHGGKKIDDYDAFNADRQSDDEDEQAALDREVVDKLHFGGGGGGNANANADDTNDNKKKTHKEIMAEVMAKSKLFKAERQKTKAAQEDATETLDADFDALKSLLSFRPSKGTKEGAELAQREREENPPDEFDCISRALAFEAKAAASERRLSPEEAAKREHDRLQELERKRVARMNGETGSDDDDDADEKKKKKKKNGKKQPQLIVMRPPLTDDDLGADYAVDQRFGGADNEEGEEDEEVEDEGEEDDDDEEEEEEDADDDNDEEEEEDEGGEDAEEEEEVEEEEEEEDENTDDKEAAAARKAARKRKREVAAAELPFVFPCPESPEELTALFKAHAAGSPSRRAQILERILKFYSPKLSADNQTKMKRFFAILVRQFLTWGKQYAVHKEDLDALSTSLFTLAQDVTDTAGVVVRELLVNLRKRLHSAKSGSASPTLAELLLFKALIQIFPVSDLRHSVLSPMETLLSESLARNALATPTDVSSALVTCALLLQMTKDKQRFTPEIVVVLKKLLRCLAVDGAGHWLREELLAWVHTANADKSELPKLALTAASSVSAPAALRSALGVMDQLSAQYAFLPSFDELVYPLYLLLHELAKSVFGGQQKQVNATIATLHVQLANCWRQRAPLRLQTFGPSVLPTFTPKFDANYSIRKDKTMDREKAKTKQLTRQVKRARKNAARELRRDASFLAREQQQEEQVRVADKKEKQKEIWAWLEQQNATFNEQAKKGGNMLTGGGSGPAKKRRVARQS